MAKATFEINPLGRSAGGQEGSGQAQILKPFDATKYQRAEDERRQKQRAANKSTDKPPTVPMPSDKFEDVGLYTHDDILTETIDENITIFENYDKLVKEGAQLKYRIDSNWDEATDEQKKEMRKELAAHEVNVANANATGQQSLKVFAWKNNYLNKLDIDATDGKGYTKFNTEASKANLAKTRGMTPTEANKYRDENIMLIPNRPLDYQKHLTDFSGYIKDNWLVHNGFDSKGLQEDPDTGFYYFTTTNNEEIDMKKVMPFLAEAYANEIRNNIALKDDLYAQVDSDGTPWINQAQEGYTRADGTEVAPIKVLNNDKAYVNWVFENKPEYLGQFVPFGDTKSKINYMQKYQGGGNVNITNFTQSTPMESGSSSDRSLNLTPVDYNANQSIYGGAYTTTNQEDSKTGTPPTPLYYKIGEDSYSGKELPSQESNTSYNHSLTLFPNFTNAKPIHIRTLKANYGIVQDRVPSGKSIDKLYKDAANGNKVAIDAITKYIDMTAITTGGVEDYDGDKMQAFWYTENSAAPAQTKVDYLNMANTLKGLPAEFIDMTRKYPKLNSGESRGIITTILTINPSINHNDLFKALNDEVNSGGTSQQWFSSLKKKFGLAEGDNQGSNNNNNNNNNTPQGGTSR